MPNHVHVIAVPSTEQSLRLAIGEAHRRYTKRVNSRKGWTGYLWQGRFSSFPMDEQHLLAAARYVELNPVRARLAATPQDYRWSSSRAHLTGRDDELVTAAPLIRIVGDWKSFLSTPIDGNATDSLRRHEHTGRPLGDEKTGGRGAGVLLLLCLRAVLPLVGSLLILRSSPLRIGGARSALVRVTTAELICSSMLPAA